MSETIGTKENSKSWATIVFVSAYHLLLIVLLPYYLYYHTPSIGILVSAFLLFVLTGLSTTAGYHRYYSHRSYKTNSFIESIILFISCMGAQGSALRWANDHRIHHAYVDTDDDPYSINKGFWYAHCLWLIPKSAPIDKKVVPDLIKNKLVMFQHHHIVTLILATNVLAVLFFGWIFNDYFGSFVFVFLLRLFCSHHTTWFINSLAHMWGDKPFSKELTAVDNYFLSILTFGEGYHNYHHTFANDYRNGIRWFHFDPTKWLIWTLNKLGLAHSLKTVDESVIKKRAESETKDIHL